MREINKKKTLYLSILAGAFFVFSQPCTGQSDSLVFPLDQPDTAILIADESSGIDTMDLVTERSHKRSPKVAWISSAIIPGLGQAYNGKYWKIPIIYGGAVAIYYNYDYNNDYYQRFKDAIIEKDKTGKITDPDLQDWSEANLKFNRDEARRKLTYDVFFMGILYVANVVDAMVDAYMFDYDVSRDLTLHLDPTIVPSFPYSYTPTCGLKLSLRF